MGFAREAAHLVVGVGKTRAEVGGLVGDGGGGASMEAELVLHPTTRRARREAALSAASRDFKKQGVRSGGGSGSDPARVAVPEPVGVLPVVRRLAVAQRRRERLLLLQLLLPLPAVVVL
jgi:hypothetical protein